MAAALPPVLLLDLDDTIVHFTAGRPDFWGEAYARHRAAGQPEVEVFTGALSDVAGPYWRDPVRAARGRLDLWRARREVALLALEALGIDDPALARRVADDFTATKEAAVAPFEGAVEALEAFAGRGVRLGLVTNGHPDFQRAKLERFDLERYFEAVLIEGEHGVGKPDPSIFHAALARMGSAPDEAWMVGDNLQADVAGAQGVGMYAVWIDHGGDGPPPGARPDRVVRSLPQLLDDDAVG